VLEYFELQYVELYLQCQECFNSCAFGLVKVSELFFSSSDIAKELKL